MMRGRDVTRREKLQRCADEFGEALASFYEAMKQFEERRGFAQVLLPVAASALNSAIFWMAQSEKYKEPING